MNLTEEGKGISWKEGLDVLLLESFTSGGAFALWRKPGERYLTWIQDFSTEARRVPLQLEELPAGFVVHPFADQVDKKAFFIQADRYLRLSLDLPFCADELPFGSAGTSTLLKGEEVKKRIAKHLASQSQEEIAVSADTGDKERFVHLVQRGLEAIAAGQLEKIVPARTKTLPLPEEFDLGATLARLLSQYPHSFVNFFHIPQLGTWMGASPEVLIQTEGDYFHTMSLAGTQPAQGDNPLKSAAWTQKEIEEQALVSRYIVDCFKTIRLREYEEHGPKTILSGNLLHLRSDFKVNMRSTGFTNLGSVMLSLLHPTSAVCGMPKKEAQAFLAAYEGFDRSFYAGFLGPVQMEGATSLFVNLRTACFRNGQVILYAGAGVTEDSDPEKEWEETELKCEIIGKFIQNPDA